MNRFKIGVIADSFNVEIREAIKKAKKAGAEGIQIYAVSEQFNPYISGAKKKEIKKLAADEGLTITALCAEMGGFTFDLLQNSKLVEKTKHILDFAVEMGTHIVTAHIGVVPEDITHPTWTALQNILHEIGEHASALGVTYAIETGGEEPEVLKRLIETTKGIGVNFDPANLVMVLGSDPVAGVYTLRDYIVHTHAKDGRMLMQSNPQAAYNTGVPPVGDGPYYIELPLGDGDVDFDGWLNALSDIGYDGFLTIEREVGDNPEEDIVKAVNFLKSKI